MMKTEVSCPTWNRFLHVGSGVSSQRTGGLDLHKPCVKLVQQGREDKLEFREKIEQKYLEKRKKDNLKRKRVPVSTFISTTFQVLRAHQSNYQASLKVRYLKGI